MRKLASRAALATALLLVTQVHAKVIDLPNDLEVPPEDLTLTCYPAKLMRETNPIIRTYITAHFRTNKITSIVTNMGVTHELLNGKKVDRNEQYEQKMLTQMEARKATWGWLGVHKKDLNLSKKQQRVMVGSIRYDGNRWHYAESLFKNNHQTILGEAACDTDTEIEAKGDTEEYRHWLENQTGEHHDLPRNPDGTVKVPGAEPENENE